jgi:hypothetical protein
MIFIVVATIGMVCARWLGWFSVIVVSVILAVAVGLEGAVETRPLFKVLKRGLEINATFQGAYLAQAFCLVRGPSLLKRPDK